MKLKMIIAISKMEEMLVAAQDGIVNVTVLQVKRCWKIPPLEGVYDGPDRMEFKAFPVDLGDGGSVLA
jgi:hypothetical protein